MITEVLLLAVVVGVIQLGSSRVGWGVVMMAVVGVLMVVLALINILHSCGLYCVCA